MKLTILGCYSATPRTFNNPTAQVLDIRGHLFLIDCGEGTQVQLRKQKIRFARIKNVFISHLHGDHFYGLPGLISTFQLLGRESELNIYGPVGIKKAILTLLEVASLHTSFPLIFHELELKSSQCIFESEKVEVHTIPLNHRIYTNGFLFKEKLKERKLNIGAVEEYNIDRAYYQNIKNGKDIKLDDGKIIANALLSYDPPTPKSYAFCSDTMYKPDIVPLITNTTVLYHEATFREEHKHLTEKTKHSTAMEAAQIAKMANVQLLILGHYSTRYGDTEGFKIEAEEVFDNVELAEDGKEFDFS